ncbi:MAG: POTRA domain-containing protein [Vicinamibacterales bacterium]
MRVAAFALCIAFTAPLAATAQPAGLPREMRFSGTAAVDALCACLLDARRIAEAEGRIDFSAEVESAGNGTSSRMTARIWMGSTHAVGRITFAGHSSLDDSTLRRAMTIYERDRLDVSELRRSVSRINGLGVFEPLTLSDISVTRRDDSVTADLTIPLRERKRRWWSVSGPMVPGFGLLQASVASRLPSWGRGIFEAATYFVSLNLTGFAKPFLALERPVIPGQEWLSGFAISPALSPRGMLTHYGRTHLAHGLGAVLDVEMPDALAVPVTSEGRLKDEPLICRPPAPRLLWLRRGAAVAVNIALAALIP